MTRAAAILCLIVISFAATPAPGQSAASSCPLYQRWATAQAISGALLENFLKSGDCSKVPGVLVAVRRTNELARRVERECGLARRPAGGSQAQAERLLRSKCKSQR